MSATKIGRRMVDRPEERRRILDMLASGQITADEAEELLRAVNWGGRDDPRTKQELAAHAATREAVTHGRREKARSIARSLRIVIDSGDEEQGNRGRVAVTIPVTLAKFASKLIPQEVRVRLEDEGIELNELLQALDQDLPEGRLVDIDTSASDEGRRARIIVEVA